jgi:hypothetical protein
MMAREAGSGVGEADAVRLRSTLSSNEKYAEEPLANPPMIWTTPLLSFAAIFVKNT